jgi:predicted dehydrogenase
MQEIRLGFVGVGNMGQCAHLRNYINLPGCRVVALAEPRPELARRVAQKYEVAGVYSNADEMQQNEQLDGLVAPQPFTHHGSLVKPLYRFGLPVLTEKPLGASVEIGEQMLKALEAGGSWHMVGYHKRNDPATIYAKAEIDRYKASGELGAMRYVRIVMPAGDWVAGGFYDLLQSDEVPPAMPADAPPSDMDAATYEQYVSFVNYYIHQVNLMRHLLGEDYSVSYADPSGVLLAVQSASGIAGTIEMSPYQTSLGWHESALVAFEHGYIKIELPAPVALNQAGRVEIFSDAKGQTPHTIVPQLPPVHAMRRQAENFVAAIRGEAKPLCEAAEALQDLRIARDYIRLWKNA